MILGYWLDKPGYDWLFFPATVGFILPSPTPYNEPLVSKQTGNIVEIRQENSGLTVVFPVDRIIETVNICIKKDIEASAVVENH